MMAKVLYADGRLYEAPKPQTIDGVTYDVAKAVRVSWIVEGQHGEPDSLRAILYFMPRGKHWFLLAQDIPASRFSVKSHDGESLPNEGIVPISKEQARQLLIAHEIPHALQTYADALVPEKRDKVIRFRVSDDELADIRQRAEDECLTIGQFIRQLVNA
jgi:predicted DNA binding CopG/RHH family protein